MSTAIALADACGRIIPVILADRGHICGTGASRPAWGFLLKDDIIKFGMRSVPKVEKQRESKIQSRMGLREIVVPVDTIGNGYTLMSRYKLTYVTTGLVQTAIMTWNKTAQFYEYYRNIVPSELLVCEKVQKKLAGSNVAAAIGLNPFKSAASSKQIGIASEDSAIRAYERKYGLSVSQRQRSVSYTTTFGLRINSRLDGVTDGKNPHIVEIKTRMNPVVRCTTDVHYDVIQLVVQILSAQLPGRIVEFHNGSIIGETRIYTVVEATHIFDKHVLPLLEQHYGNVAEEYITTTRVCEITSGGNKNAADIYCSNPIWGNPMED